MILLPLVLALAQQAPAAQAALQAAQAAPRAAPTFVRPRDPFVFRCVLDKRVRMVTVALSDELWAAWDTQQCGFVKAWKGGVKFDGAVYTTAHGPTPTSLGLAYTEGLDGDVWYADVGGKPVAVHAVWRGYRLEHGACVLLYDVVLPDGRAVRVEERPEFVVPERIFTATQVEEWGLVPGLPGLVRRFHAPAVPEGVLVAVLVRSDASRGRFIDAGGARAEKLIDVKDEKGQVTDTRIHSQIWLDAKRKTNSLIQFFDLLELPQAEPEAAPEPDAAGGAR